MLQKSSAKCGKKSHAKRKNIAEKGCTTWEEISSLLSLTIIILCNVFATPNLPGDLIVRIQFYPVCHLHENTTSQLHQNVLLLMKSKCTGFS